MAQIVALLHQREKKVNSFHKGGPNGHRCPLKLYRTPPNNSLQQTGWGGPSLNESNWRPILQQRLDTLDWKAVADDVRPFLERPTEEPLLSCSHLKTLIDPM